MNSQHLHASGPAVLDRVAIDGRFLRTGSIRYWIKGVAYGTFAPNEDGQLFPAYDRVAADFDVMRRAGANTVRTYTAPDTGILDLAAAAGLRVMAGLAWSQHVAFLDDRRTRAEIRHQAMTEVRMLAAHPSVAIVALGNEIPATVVRWLGRSRVERFLRELYDEAKAVAPECLFTYVNYPPTAYLDLSFVDLHAFNVYLHDETALRGYLAHLQHVASPKPFVVAEAGADSIREGLDGQAALTAMQLRAAFAEGACGAVAFAFTDDWWRGGGMVDDWAFGMVDAERAPKPALQAVSHVFADVPFQRATASTWPMVSVIVCAHNAADTIDQCLTSLGSLTYPSFQVIVINDGSRDDTGARARRYAGVTVIDLVHAGLSTARNVGLEVAGGEIVAYIDADAWADPDWLTYLVQPFLTSAVVGAGGPNVVPADDPWMAQCVARAPGCPTHVLIDERTAEHVPGCNMAFLRNALSAIGGFDPIYVRAGDDVDVCWRLQARGWKLGFAPSALVWHRHRSSVRAYWRQQVGYGEGQAWLVPHHPDKFAGQRFAWRGHIYSRLPAVVGLSRSHVNTGMWGTAPFPSVYHGEPRHLAFMPHAVRWQLACLVLAIVGLTLALAVAPAAGLMLAAVGTGGLALTVSRCVGYALATPVEHLPRIGPHGPAVSCAIYRLTIAWLHLVQPFARAFGQLRGMLRPPQSSPPSRFWRPRWPRPSVALALRTGWLLLGGTAQVHFWSERWITGDLLLSRLTDRLRRSSLSATLEVDDGWQSARDLRLRVGPLAWLDLRVLVEDHGGGRHLVRIGRTLRTVTPAAVVVAILAALSLTVIGGLVTVSDLGSAVGLIGAGLMGLTLIWRTSTTLAEADRVIAGLMGDMAMQPVTAFATARKEPEWST